MFLFLRFLLGGIDNRLGNANWTFHIGVTPDDNRAPGVLFNKANKFKVAIFGDQIYVQIGSRSIKVSKTYNTEIKNNKINITITKSENNVSLYVNGEKLGEASQPGDIFLANELSTIPTVSLNRGYVHEVLVTETAVSSANAISMGQYSPITPRFYHKLDLDKIASWQGNAHKVSYQNTDLTIENVPQGASVWHEKADIDAAGWQGKQTTRKSIGLGWSRTLSMPIDFSGNFTVSFWMYFENSPPRFLSITEDSDSSKRLDLMAFTGGEPIWVKHSKSDLKRTRDNFKHSIYADPLGSFKENYWNHIVMVKNGGTLGFWINGKASEKFGGQYLKVDASKTDSQGMSTMMLGGQNNLVYYSDLFVMDSAIVHPFMFHFADSYPEIEKLMNGTYFFEG